MQREGVFREMRRRKAYEKPSERKSREKAEAIRRVPDGGDLQPVVYVVAVEDPVRAVEIVGAEVG
jgi:hypothetical protein